MIDYPAFRTAIGRRHGRVGLSVRHELFHHAVVAGRWRPKPLQALRAIAVTVRDAAWLAVGGAAARETGTAEPAASAIVLAATLPGPSGLALMLRARGVVEAAGHPTVLVVHPRLRAAAGSAARTLRWPGVAALLRAGRRACSTPGGSDRDLSTVAVRAAVWRQEIWREAWDATLARGSVVLMHNDVEAMMVAAIGSGRVTLCLQHGLPTEELFPVLADRQVVWSRRAAAAYADAGAPASALVVDALGRAPAVAAADRPAGAPPTGIALISQTHATILRRDLPERLVDFARGLAAAAPGSEVLLHPEETRRGHPYDGIPGLVLRTPPHDVLRPGGGEPRLVVGLLSTALIDAAAAGSFVAGIDWPIDGNRAAAALGIPPRRLRDAAEATGLLRQLQASVDARAAMRSETADWLGSLFEPAGGGLSRELAAFRRSES